MNISVGWVIAGVVVAGGILLYMHSQQQNALAAQNPLAGVGDGVVQSRQDVVEGLKFGQTLANLGSEITKAVIASQPKASQMTQMQAANAGGSTGSLRSSSVTKNPVKK